jgi:hypothetical protein
MFDRLATEAAESAESMLELAESEEYAANEEVVESDFSEMTAALLEGLELYAELIEDEDIDEGKMPTDDEDAEGSKGKKKDEPEDLEKEEAKEPSPDDGGDDQDADGEDDDSIAKNSGKKDEGCADGMGMPKADDEEPADDEAGKSKKPDVKPEMEGKAKGKGKK